jgi:hypothetical protein
MKKAIALLLATNVAIADNFGNYFVINKLLEITNDQIKNERKIQKEKEVEQKKHELKMEAQAPSKLEEKIKQLKNHSTEERKTIGEYKFMYKDITYINKNEFSVWVTTEKEKQLTAFNCSHKMSKLLAYYKKKKKWEFMPLNDEMWLHMPPGSIGESVLEAICPSDND